MSARRAPVLLALGLLAPFAAHAADVLFADAKLNLDLRYRLESVQQTPFSRDALASTLRARLGLSLPLPDEFTAFVEYESVIALGPDDYNSTANGNTSFPVVADPTDHEVNQAWLQWQDDGLRVRYGRQRITLDNQRFIGNVGFRQNEQTFDGLTFAATFGAGTLTLAHLDNANRVFGANHPLAARADTRLDLDMAHFALKALGGTFAVYMHDIGLPDTPLASHRNLGVRYAGEYAVTEAGKLRFSAEFAKQTAARGGAASIDQDYRALEIGYSQGRYGARFGTELLGGDGVRGFQTPLATLHAFDGWADRFLTTPAGGLEDRYLGFDARFGKFKAVLVHHSFSSDVGAVDYGSELDLVLSRPLNASTTVKLEYADYSAAAFATDTRIVWLSVESHF